MQPLEGMKVVELGMYVAAPGITRLLGDWGAEVIKIESPTGDKARVSGSRVRLPIKPDCNPTFSLANSGKKLICLDLKTPEGMEVMHKLLADADVFVSNTRYGGLIRLGLDYETLHVRYPKLICCYVNGYGFEGPEQNKAGFDLTSFWAKSGILNALRHPGETPRFPPPGIGDTATANVAAAGILAAVCQRYRTGEGTKVTTSLMATAIWSNYSHVAAAQDRPPQDDLKPLHAPEHFKEWKDPFYHIYKCKDGKLFFLLGGGFSKLHRTLETLGYDDLLDDPRFENQAAMIENSSYLYDRMIETFATKTAEEWIEILTPLDISFEVISASEDVVKDPQAWANGCLTHMHCPDGSTYVMPNTPVEFEGAERAQTCHSGDIGSDTRAVLESLGYTAAEIQELLEKGAAVEPESN